MSSRPDHGIYREWLNLEAERDLGPDERARLDEHLAFCPECRREREELQALDSLLKSVAIPVRSDFQTAVMSALPTAGWEARAPRAWRFTALVILMLGSLAAALMIAGPGAGPAPSGLGALFAVGGMLRAAVVAGAGLLGASWKGAGLILDRLITSPASLGAFGFLVLCLNLFLVSLIRRRKPAGAMARRERL